MTAIKELATEYVCAGCYTPHKTKPLGENAVEPPDNGWLVPFAKLGYYGGFTDHFLDDDWENVYFVCHECCNKIVALLPGIHSLMHGGHPGSLNEKPCCDYAWTYDFQNKIHYRPLQGEWVAHETEGVSDE